MKLYKYIGPETLDKVFVAGSTAGFKCSYPKDYNDPYELFMGLSGYDNLEIVAYFNDIMTSIPQQPTTCFSKRPDVVPMWAHYAHQSRGFVVEIDEGILMRSLPDGAIRDVDYRDGPQKVDADSVGRACVTCKPRHTYWIVDYAMHTAYYTKSMCWEYEMERRLVAKSEDVDKDLVLHLPSQCVTAVIAGLNTSDQDVEKCRAICDERGYSYYQLNIGRSSTTPFFLDGKCKTFLYGDEEMKEVDECCNVCGEPCEENKDGVCQWCSLDEGLKAEASMKNPLRMFDHYGLLGGYFKSVSKIGRPTS